MEKAFAVVNNFRWRVILYFSSLEFSLLVFFSNALSMASMINNDGIVFASFHFAQPLVLLFFRFSV